MRKLPSGAAVEVFETLDSTSAEAKRRAEKGALGPEWIIALRQTAGYGRRGRSWEQSGGDFAGSRYFAAHAPRQALGQFSFIAALALYDAIAKLVPDKGIRIKWPNDVLIDSAKIAGLLLEMVETKGEPILILGIGVNMVSAPALADYPTTRLMDHGLTAPASPLEMVFSLDANLHAYESIWRKEGFAPIRQAWLERAAGLGKEITVRLPNKTITGIFEDINDSGALMLRFDGGMRTISAGDVYFDSNRL